MYIWLSMNLLYAIGSRPLFLIAVVADILYKCLGSQAFWL
jgi:hypothetical protein